MSTPNDTPTDRTAADNHPPEAPAEPTDDTPEDVPDDASGLRRRSVIAGTLASPALFGLGFAASDPGRFTASTTDGSASPTERAMAGVPVLAQMDEQTVEMDEEPAQDVPTNQYRTLHVSDEILDELEREEGDQVRVEHGEDSAVFTITGTIDEELEEEEEEEDELEEEENDIEEEEENDLEEEEENDVEEEEEEVEEVENGVVRTTREGKCRLAFHVDDPDEEADVEEEENEEHENDVGEEHENDEHENDVEPENDIEEEEEEEEVEDFRRWGPLRGDDNCELADETFEVVIYPAVPDPDEVEEEEIEEEEEDEEEEDNDEFGSRTRGYGQHDEEEAEDDEAEDEEEELEEAEEELQEEGEFTEQFREGEERLAVLAPHGGEIQPWTADQARHLAEEHDEVTAYTAEGFGQNNAFYRWYIPSNELSEASYPQLAELMEEEYEYAISFHGVHDDTIHVGGGADEDEREALADAIEEELPHDASPVQVAEPPYEAEGDETLVNRVTENGDGIWIGQPISDRRDSWEEIAQAVSDALDL